MNVMGGVKCEVACMLITAGGRGLRKELEVKAFFPSLKPVWLSTH